jgi:osmotically-inducible protein OsmY
MRYRAGKTSRQTRLNRRARCPALFSSHSDRAECNMVITDKELEKIVADRLRKDGRLAGSKIQVEVNDADVILQGSAESHQASAFAQEDAAEVAGVEKIVNRIEVPLPEKIAPPTDEGIRARIQAMLSSESENAPVDFVLAVAEGVVFIDGFVETLKEKRQIGNIAARERGVLEVRNHLTVVPGRDRDDEELSARIQAALESVAELGNIKSVRLRVEEGVATLTGTVASPESRRRVNTAVSSVAGVRDVRDKLDVGGRAGDP